MLRLLSSFLLAGVLSVGLCLPAFAQPSFLTPGYVRFVAKTATGNLDISETGVNVVITNTGATGAIVLTLPNCDDNVQPAAPPYTAPFSTIGMVVNVVLTVAQDVDLNPFDATDFIRVDTDAAGDAVSSPASIGSGYTLVCVADNVWARLHATGTWTDVN